MGQVRKQGTSTFIITLLGVTLGYVNKTLLFANFLDTDYFGLTEFLVAMVAMLYGVASMGLPGIINKYYHYIVPHRRLLGSFNFFVLLVPALSLTLISLLLVLLKGPIVAEFSEKSPLVGEKFWHLFPLLFAYVAFEILASYSSAILKNVIPAFLREIFLRLGHTLAIVLLLLRVVDQDGFVWFFILMYWVNLIAVTVYVRWLGRFPLGLHGAIFKSRYFKSMLRYGGFFVASTLVWAVVMRVDITLIAAMLDLDKVAVFSLAVYLGSLVYLPGRTLSVVATPLITKALKAKNLKEVDNLYGKTSLNNMIVGGLLALGIYYNIDSLFTFMKPEFALAKVPIILIVLGKWFDVSTGTGNVIMLASRHYPRVLVIVLIVLVVILVGNLMLIPRLELVGAAIVSMSGTVLTNALIVGFIWKRMGIQPFRARALRIIPVLAATILAGELLPPMGTPLVDMLVRSGLIALVYGTLVLVLQVSPDLNQMFTKLLKRLRLVK